MESSVFISAHIAQLLAEADPFSCHLARTSSVTIQIKSSQRRTWWSNTLLPLSWHRVRRWQKENDIFTLCLWSTWLCSERTDFEIYSHPYNDHYIIQITLFLELPIHWNSSEIAQNCVRDLTGRQGPSSPLQGIWSEPMLILPPSLAQCALALIDKSALFHSTQCPLRALPTLLSSVLDSVRSRNTGKPLESFWSCCH